MGVTRAGVESSIHAGIQDANRQCAKWTNGYLVKHFGVEGVVVACVAASIHRKQTKRESLWIEVPFSYIKERAKARVPRGRPPALLANRNRADIVLFNARDEVTTIIELKRSWSRRPCVNDLRRIGGLVVRYNHANGGTLRRGFLGLSLATPATTTNTARERMDARLERISEAVEDLKESLPGCNVRTSTRQRVISGWRVASLVVEVASKMESMS